MELLYIWGYVSNKGGPQTLKNKPKFQLLGHPFFSDIPTDYTHMSIKSSHKQALFWFHLGERTLQDGEARAHQHEAGDLHQRLGLKEALHFLLPQTAGRG